MVLFVGLYGSKPYALNVEGKSMQIRTIVIILIFSGLSACMPVMFNTYYHPEASEGVLSQSLCSERIGPFDRIYFNRNEIKIGINLYYLKKSYFVRVVFRVPEGKKVSISNQNIILKINGERHTGKIQHTSGWPPWESTDPPTLVGKSGRVYYELEARIKAPEVDIVFITIPKLIINNQQYNVPEIKFYLDKAIEYFMPINC